MKVRGFTLIEVVVALAIVALGMSTLLMTLGSAADTAGYLRDKAFAEWIAFNQLTLTRVAGQMPAAGSSEGDLDFAGRHWHWKQDVTQLGFPGILRIDVRVQPNDGTSSKDDWLATVTGAMGNAVASSQLVSLYAEPGQMNSSPASSAPTSSAPAGSQPSATSLMGQPAPASAPAAAQPPADGDSQ